MTRRTRSLVLLAGLLLIAGGLLALGYAGWPIETARLTATLPPTLFAPP
ncbi:MAG: hypothetical protein ACKOC5_06860 [Chloroflexota bacterium]